MQAFMEPAKKKIIQKRVARRERFARMARIRHRKDKEVIIAKAQDMDIPHMFESQNTVYQHSLGFLISETEGGLDTELSLLNESYISNSITVLNETNKMICVKLHKNDHKGNELKEAVLNEWASREDPYWVEWARHFKDTTKGCNDFINKNLEKFTASKIDEESMKKQRAYALQRDELMSKKPCLELRTRFTPYGSAVSEIIFNSAFVQNLNYDFEEFIQKILIEGIPRLRPMCQRGLKKVPALFENFDDMFDKSFETTYPDTIFIAKNENFTKFDYTLLTGGYFVKNAAEISYIISLNGTEQVLEGQTLNKPIYRLFMEQQMSNEAEKKYFLEMFYKDHLTQLMSKPKLVCQIRSCVDEIDIENEEVTDNDSVESRRLSEELVVKDKIDLTDRAANKEAIVSVPYTDYLTQLMPQMQLMKTIYENQQRMLSQLLQQEVVGRLSKP